MKDNQFKPFLKYVIIITFVVIALLTVTSSFNLYTLQKDFASTTASFGVRISTLEADLATTTKTNADLAQKISDQQNLSNSVQQSLGGLASTVNTLEKLSKTDQELLQKYSKVYFLSENYVPIMLSSIDRSYLSDTSKSLQFHTYALNFLARMLNDNAISSPNSKGLVASAYRSFGTQSALKSSYNFTYGSGANKFSADQGYSEHQLGTAVDLVSSNSNSSDNLTISFENTSTFAWLQNNAHRYGFILSYPKGNSYYQYEPWHWRFVGVRLATYLHDQNKNFYDLDQRTIDTYLSTIFDN